MAQIAVKQAAKILGITERRVRQLAERGQLRAEKIGRDWLIDDSGLEVAIDRPAVGRPQTTGAGIQRKDRQPGQYRGHLSAESKLRTRIARLERQIAALEALPPVDRARYSRERDYNRAVTLRRHGIAQRRNELAEVLAKREGK